MTTPAPSPIVELLRKGDIARGGMVMSYCGAGAARALQCDTCNYAAPNRAAMTQHVRQPGTHRLTSFCERHRWTEEVPPKPLVEGE